MPTNLQGLVFRALRLAERGPTEPANMALTSILRQAPDPPRRRVAPRTCARESVAFGYHVDRVV